MPSEESPIRRVRDGHLFEMVARAQNVSHSISSALDCVMGNVGVTSRTILGYSDSNSRAPKVPVSARKAQLASPPSRAELLQRDLPTSQA